MQIAEDLITATNRILQPSAEERFKLFTLQDDSICPHGNIEAKIFLSAIYFIIFDMFKIITFDTFHSRRIQKYMLHNYY